LSIELIFDESVDARIIESIVPEYPGSLSITKSFPGIPDEEIIPIVVRHNAILITEDKDFGEWVFSHGRTIPAVILLRYHHTELMSIVGALRHTLNKDLARLRGQFVVIAPKRVRYREMN